MTPIPLPFPDLYPPSTVNGPDSPEARLQANLDALSTGANPSQKPYTVGSASLSTGGAGAGTVVISHGLGDVPAHVIATLGATAAPNNPTYRWTASTTTTFTLDYSGGAAFSTYPITWAAFR